MGKFNLNTLRVDLQTFESVEKKLQIQKYSAAFSACRKYKRMLLYDALELGYLHSSKIIINSPPFMVRSMGALRVVFVYFWSNRSFSMSHNKESKIETVP